MVGVALADTELQGLSVIVCLGVAAITELACRRRAFVNKGHKGCSETALSLEVDSRLSIKCALKDIPELFTREAEGIVASWMVLK